MLHLPRCIFDATPTPEVVTKATQSGCFGARSPTGFLVLAAHSEATHSRQRRGTVVWKAKPGYLQNDTSVSPPIFCAVESGVRRRKEVFYRGHACHRNTAANTNGRCYFSAAVKDGC